MSWFEDQIEQRKKQDQDMFNDSIMGMAAAVLGRGRSVTLDDRHLVAKLAIDEIMKYYGYKPVKIPDSLKDPEERLDYCLRPHGLMQRRAVLEKGWHRNAFGPMICYRREDGLPVALIPSAINGYWYRDPATGAKVRVNSSREKLFAEEARCFYRPLPDGKVGLAGLTAYIRENILPADVVMFCGITLLITLTGLLIPVITRILTGDVVKTGSIMLLVGTAQFLMVVLLTTALLTAAKGLVNCRLQVRLSQSLEAAVFMRVLNLPVRFFRDYSAGDLARRIQHVPVLGDLLINSLFSAGITAVLAILYMTQMIRFASALVLPALAVVFLTALISVLTALLQMKYSRRVMEYEAKASGISYALITGIQKLRLAGAEKRAFARWADVYAREAEAAYNPPLLLKIEEAVLTCIGLLGTVLMYWLAVRTHVDPSEYLAFNAAYGMMAAAFAQLSVGVTAAAKIRPVMELTEPILNAETENSTQRNIVTKLTGSIEINNVSFRYGSEMRNVLQNLSLRVRKGEYVAITGRSGCGKSTLFRLLLGFESPQRGSISIDGHDIRTLDLHSLRRKIGTVIQNGALIKGDIYSNIVLTAPYLGMEEAWAAAEMAGIAADIRQMPMGMHTIVSEGQGGLSGGQKQRLLIARAIAGKPSVLLMDEATSALDNKTQKQVSDALAQLNCTRIVIAHRLSTIRQCDRILVMDEGHIAEEGTYEELIARKGLFAELVERQRL